jgi:hypothetical protein
MGPGWSDVLRFADGARLRVDCTLSAPMRHAIAQSSRRAGAWLDAADGATLRVLQVTRDSCELQCEAASLAGLALHASREPDASTHRLRCVLSDASGAPLELGGLVLQSGGRAEAWFAHDTEAGRQQLGHLRYERDGTASLAVVGAAFAHRVPAHLRALVPSRLAVARLVPLAG